MLVLLVVPVVIEFPFSVHDQLVAEKGAGELVPVIVAIRPGTNCNVVDKNGGRITSGLMVIQ